MQAYLVREIRVGLQPTASPPDGPRLLRLHQVEVKLTINSSYPEITADCLPQEALHLVSPEFLSYISFCV